jgi:hypothetical protein
MMSQRKNDFNDKTWWLVDINPIGGEEMISRQGATALVKRCMRAYCWNESKARKVLNAYRQFLSLKKETKDWNDNILSPCYLVDQMWQIHILDVVNYCHDMMLLCGHVVGYNPDCALDHVEKQKREETTHALLERFGSEYDKEMWCFSSSSSNSRQMIQRVQKDHKMSSSRQIQRAQKEQKKMSSKFQIYVKYHDKTMTFWVRANDTIGRVKDAIQQKRDIPSHLQRLTYGFKALTDERTLDDCNITKECTLHLCRIYSKTSNRSYRCNFNE